MIKVLRKSFGTVILHDCYAIVEIKEGIILSQEHNNALIEIGKEHFGDQPFGCISNRINSYSVDPTIYITSTMVHNLKAIAIVSKNPTSRSTAILEKTFYGNHFEIFKDIEVAKDWILPIITAHRASA